MQAVTANVISVFGKIVPDDKSQTADDDKRADGEQHERIVIKGNQRTKLTAVRAERIKTRIAKSRYR